MSPKDWLDQATQVLKYADVASPRLDAQLLLEHVLKRDRASISIDEDSILSDESHEKLDLMLDRRAKREPLAYILGQREFYGLNFKVDNGVLVPRPETEVLVEYAIDKAPKNAQILELGTGSGAIALALAKNRTDLDIIATDVSADALNVAKHNAKALNLDVEMIESDLFEEVNGKFDLILANLPYVPEPARRQPEITHEPDVALYGGEDGMDFYRAFFKSLNNHLDDSGFAVIEFSPTQYASVREEFSDFKFEPISEYIYLIKPKN